MRMMLLIETEVREKLKIHIITKIFQISDRIIN